MGLYVTKAQESTKVIVPKIYIKAYQGVQTPIESAKVKLLEVLEDSRCPKNVDCVWAGEAKVRVEIYDNGTKRIEDIVINTRASEPLFINDGLAIHIRGLAPYPETSAKISPKDYYLLVEASAN